MSMEWIPRMLLAVALPLAAVPSAAAAAPAPSAAAVPAVDLAPGVALLPGRFVPDVQPDGNTVIFRGPEGLVVIDTGRHADHTQSIVDFARRERAPVRVVVNTHWHLDHVGGNPRLRREFPGVRIYASSALSGALTGFLASYRASLEAQLEKAPSPEKAEPLRAEIAIIDAGPALAPDEIVAGSGERLLAGLHLDLHLETFAVTAGDVWVFDPRSKVLAAGDLVTLPVPFLDTACPERWGAALDHLAKTDFKVLVPGHGPPLHRRELETYRRAFGNLLSCAASTRGKQECIEGWMRDAGELLGNEDPAFTRALLDYYVGDQLRGDPARTAKLCGR
jgi:glyoxylase-like metal-dependent hydrolase (beta-lactamase superfamily II)